MDGLIFLADAPASAPQGDSPATCRIPIAKLGRFRDPRYGRFEIKGADFEAWRRNFREVKPEVQIDLDHASEKPGGSSEAAGWIKDLEPDGQHLYAKIEWTPVGLSAVKEKRYRFVSPAFGTYADEEGRKHRNTLRSVALTNRPFLRRDMPAITLSEADIDSDGVLAEEEGESRDEFDVLLDQLLDAGSVGPAARGQLRNLLKHYAGKPHPFTACVRDNTKRFGPEGAERVCATLKDIIRGTTRWRKGGRRLDDDTADELRELVDALSEQDLTKLALTVEGESDASDSRGRMAPLPNIAKALGLDEDADEAKILEAIEARDSEDNENADEAKSLEDRARDEGKKLLDQDAFTELERKAQRGEQAATELSETKFNNAFSAAMDEGKVGDAQREDFKQLYDQDPDRTLALLGSLEPVVNTSARGKRGDDEEVPDGVDPDSAKLDREVRALMAENSDLDYPTALSQALAKQEAQV